MNQHVFNAIVKDHTEADRTVTRIAADIERQREQLDFAEESHRLWVERRDALKEAINSVTVQPTI